MQDYSLLRGPCPYGFHVPTRSEALIFQNIHDDAYVKMDIDIGYIDENGDYIPVTSSYWTSTMGMYNHPYYIWERYEGTFYVVDTQSERYSDGYNHYGRKIRPFKDTPITPDNTWTMLYDGSSTATGAGIFWNEGAGLISISFDGVNRTTIADKDLGATTVGGMGLMYQRGNNHGWAYNDTISKRSTLPDLSGYGPMNQYSSSVFVTGSSQAFLVNHNLRGYETFSNGTYKRDYSLLRGPCPEGFHVPISTEWQDIIQMIGSLGLTNNSSVVYTTYLKLQYHGYYDSYMRTKIINNGETVYRCCDKYNLDTNNSAAVTFNIHTPNGGTGIASMYHSRKDNGCSIRPFKDTQVIPDSSRTVLYDGSSVATGAGIFRDQNNGLISISSDGFNWKTISDSDLSAATGSYFQRGNDYAFSGDDNMPGGGYSSRPNTQGFGPKNHYISANFITLGSANVSWDNPSNNDLWGYESFILDQNDIFLGSGPGILKNADTQGPCQDWFHVPTLEECSKLFDMYRNMLGEGGVNFMTYLHFPTMGYLSHTTGEPSAQTWGYYWTSQIASYEGTNNNNADYYGFTSNNILEASSSGRSTSYGLPIRPFRNAPVIPDDTWTASYDISTDTKKVGIFWDQNRGLISISSNGTDWITIADKNLGATQVYNYGDTVSETNAGGYFQWGNNYMFPFAGAGTVVTSTTNARNYGPGNYYSSDVYRGRGVFSWDSSKNKNLWGGETNNMGYKKLEIYIGEEEFKNDRTLLQGPCESGFHVPTYPEWFYFYKVLDNIGVPKGDWWRINLHMPFAGMRNFNTGEKDKEGTWCYYRSSSLYSNSGSYPRRASSCCFDSSTLYWNSLQEPASALFIRPFRNKTIRPNSSLTGWTVLFDGSSYAEGAGVFQRQSDGLITAYDGERTYTISDKNCGATVAYNDGDTLSQANCGYCYQRGNNYGFPWTGSLTNISSTKVDVLDYGPYNPYYGDTFITTAIQSNRAEVRNEDLWGYISYYDNYPSNVAEVYKGTTLVRSNYKPIVPAIGVYWNPTKGLISLSDDGKKWMTIADKNLGAKYCYEQGQTPSQDNMGYLFQGGNNFPFKYSGPIPTISDTDRGYRYPSVVVTEGFATGTVTGNKKNARGGDSPKLESAKGPCPDGFHVPTYSDMYFIVQKLTEWGLTNSAFTQYLKMPDMGFYSERAIKQTSNTYYLTCTHERGVNNTNQYCAMILRTTNNYTVVSAYDNLGCPIRPFKNDYVSYSSSYKIYSYDDYSGIWYNQSDGLITIGDKYRKITISDKNLGATQVWNEGDTKSQTNCGGYFQRGNNNMFSYNGPTHYGQIRQDVTGYGPGNYYSNNYFVTRRDNTVSWMQDINYNLRGGDDIDYEKAIGPCGEGWHIATYIELNKIISILNSYSDTYEPKILLKAPTDGNMIYTQGTIKTTSGVSFRGCSQAENRYYMLIKSNGSNDVICVAYPTIYGFPIRPFKNEPVVPNDTSRIKLT